MIIAIIFLTGLAAFSIGFFLGTLPIKTETPVKTRPIDRELMEIADEYRNFLNYDGSEQ